MALSVKEQARKAARQAEHAAARQEVRGTRIYAGPEKIDRSSPHVTPSRVKQRPVTQTWETATWRQAERTEGKEARIDAGNIADTGCKVMHSQPAPAGTDLKALREKVLANMAGIAPEATERRREMFKRYYDNGI